MSNDLKKECVFIDVNNTFNLTECCICLDDFKDNTKVIVFHCEHMVCNECDKNLKKCPYCRKSLKTKSFPPAELRPRVQRRITPEPTPEPEPTPASWYSRLSNIPSSILNYGSRPSDYIQGPSPQPSSQPSSQPSLQHSSQPIQYVSPTQFSLRSGGYHHQSNYQLTGHTSSNYQSRPIRVYTNSNQPTSYMQQSANGRISSFNSNYSSQLSVSNRIKSRY